MHENSWFVSCLWFLALAVVAGCQPGEPTSKPDADNHEADHGHSHDHDHSGRHESLQSAINELTEIRDSIRAAMEKNAPDAAHGPLHHVPELLEAMPDLAADTDLPESDWNEVKAAADKLFDAFSKIDAAFHEKEGDKKGAYEEVRGMIDQELEVLKAKLPLLVESPFASPDDHAHSDEGGTGTFH